MSLPLKARGVPGIFFYLSPAWQRLLLKEITCLFRLVTSRVNALKVMVDFFTRGSSEKLNGFRPSAVEESHFQGLGKTFPPLLHHCQPFGGSKAERISACVPPTACSLLCWSTWETQVKTAHIKWFLIRIISYERVGRYPFPYICCYFLTDYWLKCQLELRTLTFQQFIISLSK